MRKIYPIKPCEKCGEKLEVCTTDELSDCWGISKCTNPNCTNWKNVMQLIDMGYRIVQL